MVNRLKMVLIPVSDIKSNMKKNICITKKVILFFLVFNTCPQVKRPAQCYFKDSKHNRELELIQV